MRHITNTIRHGDVCILVGPDPFCIEIKSSQNTNARVNRQIENLKALQDFLVTDEAKIFRGFPRIIRAEYKMPLCTHLDALNHCIEQSSGRSISVVSPEQGHHYLCVRDPKNLNELGSDVINANSFVCMLNEAKSKMCWMPFYPFTLSIRSPIQLYEFILGAYTLAVVIDESVLIKQCAAKGVRAVFDHSGDYAIWFRKDSEQQVSGVSRQMLQRIFYEFQSLSWFVDMCTDNQLFETVLLDNSDDTSSSIINSQVNMQNYVPTWVQQALSD